VQGGPAGLVDTARDDSIDEASGSPGQA
jgi:hypothetical protein